MQRAWGLAYKCSASSPDYNAPRHSFFCVCAQTECAQQAVAVRSGNAVVQAMAVDKLLHACGPASLAGAKVSQRATRTAAVRLHVRGADKDACTNRYGVVQSVEQALLDFNLHRNCNRTAALQHCSTGCQLNSTGRHLPSSHLGHDSRAWNMCKLLC
jgi:hypothetical protein